jgi:CTD kinase subunit beta
LYTFANSRNDISKYTKIKIDINNQAQKRGPDPIMDEITREELQSKPSDLDFKGFNPLDIVNSNQHTVSYHFSDSSAS